MYRSDHPNRNGLQGQKRWEHIIPKILSKKELKRALNAE